MNPDFFSKTFRNMKIIQMILLLVMQIFYVLLLLFYTELRELVLASPALMVVCFTIWGFFLFSLAFLFYDFSKLRLLAKETHMLSQLAYLDSLTGIPNRYSLDLIFRIFRTPESVQSIGCMVIKITNLKTINGTFGHETGDRLIQDFCSIFEEVGDEFGYLGRNGGNEFVIVIENCSSEKEQDFLKFLNHKLDLYNQKHPDTPICITVASILNREAHADSLKDLLTLTYAKLLDM